MATVDVITPRRAGSGLITSVPVSVNSWSPSPSQHPSQHLADMMPCLDLITWITLHMFDAFTSMCAKIRKCIHMHMRVCIRKYKHTYTHATTQARAPSPAYTDIQTQSQRRTHARASTQKHAHLAHVHAHVSKQTLQQRDFCRPTPAPSIGAPCNSRLAAGPSPPPGPFPSFSAAATPATPGLIIMVPAVLAKHISSAPPVSVSCCIGSAFLAPATSAGLTIIVPVVLTSWSVLSPSGLLPALTGDVPAT